MSAPRLALTRTYLAPVDAPAEGSAPGGGELPGVADVRPGAGSTNEETHYDTVDLALAAAGASVRRQTGGAPRGWVLELPGRGPRTHEVRTALGRAVRTAPAALQRLTWAAARGRSLGPVLQISTVDVPRELLDAEGRLLARVTARTVTARPLSPAESVAQTWVEWQAEVVDGRRDLLDAITDAWEEMGAEESDRTEQVRTVLDDLEDEAAPEGGDKGTPSAGAVVLGQLAEDVAALLAADPLVRIDAPEVVVGLRTAVRRLRRVLQVYGSLFGAERREALVAELDWFVAVVDEVRAVEVLQERLAEEAAEERLAEGAGDVAGAGALLEERLGARHGAARAALLEVMDSERYRELVAALEAFVAAPDLTKDARKQLKKGTLLPFAAEAHRAVRDAYREIDPDGDAGDPSDPLTGATLLKLGETAESARSAAETLVRAYGDDVETYVHTVRDLLDVLADLRDSVAARELLEATLDAPGPVAFVIGRLHALEEVRSAMARHDLDEAWDEANRKKLRRWMG
ncbi:CHAD domain-containing protein [Kineococcus gynurae]|uniref:CHAD domain-containing protein n=1 Tax=Kineococcus gynurae TaxID=452979 RepID=A0ABV5LSK2_9ACTN